MPGITFDLLDRKFQRLGCFSQTPCLVLTFTKSGSLAYYILSG